MTSKNALEILDALAMFVTATTNSASDCLLFQALNKSRDALKYMDERNEESHE